MIPGLLGSITFSAPYFLFGIPLIAGGLFWIYKKQREGVKIIVPSTIIWRNLASEFQAPRKQKLPWRYLLDLLICTIILLALSNPQIIGKSEKYSILIDNSFSTFALDANSGFSRMTLTSLIEKAQDEIERFSNSTFKIYLSSPKLTALTSSFVPEAEAQQLLAKIKSSYSQDQLENRIKTIRAYEKDIPLLIFTDRSHPVISSKTDSIKVHRLGSETGKLNNITISGASFDFSSGKEPTLLVTINSFSHNFSVVNLQIESSDWPVSLSSSRRIALKLEPFEEKEVKVTLKNLAKIYRLSLDLEPKERLANNLIKEDDVHWIISARPTTSFGLVSTKSIEEIGLNQVPGYRFVKTTLNSPELKNFSNLIVHREFLKNLPVQNTLVIAPRSKKQDNYFQFNRVGEETSATSWSQNDRLLRYVQFNNFKFPALNMLVPPDWSQSLVSNTHGSLLAKGTLGKSRYVFSSFELLPFEGKHAAELSILMLNILQWLSENSAERSSAATYERVYNPESQQSIQSYPEHIDLITNGSYFAASEPAILKYESTDPKFIAINYFNRSESNIADDNPLSISPEDLKTSLETNSLSIKNYLVWSLVALFLLEAIFLTLKTLLARKTTLKAG